MVLGKLEASGRVSQEVMGHVQHDLELLDIAGNAFSREEFLEGAVTPVFFASALTNFGIESFLDVLRTSRPVPLRDWPTATMEPNCPSIRFRCHLAHMCSSSRPI